jgi:hypothetical protein
MGVGDVYSGFTTITSGSSYDIRPSLGTEVVIHNIYHDNNIALQWTDGTTAFTFDYAQGSGVYAKFAFHVTYNYFVRVLNQYAGNTNIGWDGIVTK